MQFALEKYSLAPCENEIRLFASTYRRTEGQVNFLAGNGLLKGPFVEMTGIVVGFNSWALGRFRTSGVASRDTGEYCDFEDWLDNKFGKDCPAGARLVEMREAYCLSALNHDTVRAALFEYMTTGHAHLLEHACANNGDKYRSVLEAWRVVLETCPDMVLINLMEAISVDCTSHFQGNDEFEETYHSFLSKEMKPFTGHSWMSNIRPASTSVHEKGLGADFGRRQATMETGKRQFEPYIAQGVVQVLNKIFPDGDRSVMHTANSVRSGDFVPRVLHAEVELLVDLTTVVLQESDDVAECQHTMPKVYISCSINSRISRLR